MPALINAAVPVFEPGPDDWQAAPRTSLLNGTAPLAPPPTAADAADVAGPALAQNARDTWAAVKDPQTWSDAANQYRMAMLLGSTAPGEGGILAYHGSPHSFDRFDLAKIGTGEGAQAYGHGLYFAGAEDIAKYYRDTLSKWTNNIDKHVNDHFGLQLPEDTLRTVQQVVMGSDEPTDVTARYLFDRVPELRSFDPGSTLAAKPNLEKLVDAIRADRSKGSMYQVSIAARPEHMLDWDAPRDRLAPAVQAFARENYPGAWEQAADGSSLYQIVAQHAMREREGLQKMLASKRADGDTRPFPADEARLEAMQNPYAYVSEQMRQAGIPGIRYLDAGSRGGGEGSHNYVVFNDNLINVLRKYGIAGLLGGGGAAAGAAAAGGDNSERQ